MALTAEQLDRLVNEELRPTAERIRAERARLASVLARTPAYTDIAAEAKAIVQERKDAARLATVTEADVRDLVYALETVNSALAAVNGDLLEKFCVRPLEVIGA